jgi:hypothetical protein
MREISWLATRLTNVRRMRASCRSFRQPETTSAPSSSFAQQQWNVLGVVLEIGIECDDDITRCMINAGHQRSGLPSIVAKFYDLDFAVCGGRAGEPFRRPVSAAIIDEDDFKTVIYPFEHGYESLDEWRYAVFLVEHGHNDRQFSCSLGC